MGPVNNAQDPLTNHFPVKTRFSTQEEKKKKKMGNTDANASGFISTQMPPKSWDNTNNWQWYINNSRLLLTDSNLKWFSYWGEHIFLKRSFRSQDLGERWEEKGYCWFSVSFSIFGIVEWKIRNYVTIGFHYTIGHGIYHCYDNLFLSPIFGFRWTI